MEVKRKMKATIRLVFLAGCAIFIYILARGVLLSITHDEALTFDILNGDLIRATTPNDHLLNTFLCGKSIRLFGASEWALRLPNMLAYLIYLVFSLRILIRLSDPVLLIAGFLLLHLNPFLLDFFSLARGYGLSIAFMTMSIYYLDVMFEDRRWDNVFLNIGAWGAAFAAVLANFTILVFYLTALTGFVIFAAFELFRKYSQRKGIAALIAVVVNLVFLEYVARLTLKLHNGGQLFYGGQEGFLHDVVRSNFDCLLYFAQYGWVAEWFYTALLLTLPILAILGLRALWIKSAAPFVLFAFLLFVTAGFTILIHYAQRVLYPTERMALFFYPLWTFAIIFCCSSVRQKAARYIITGFFALALSAHFLYTVNLQYCYIWYYDRYTKDTVTLLEKERAQGREAQIGAHWKFGPAINFYQKTKGLNWLNRVEIPGFDRKKIYPYYYILADERKELPAQGFRFEPLLVHPDVPSAFLRTIPDSRK